MRRGVKKKGRNTSGKWGSGPWTGNKQAPCCLDRSAEPLNCLLWLTLHFSNFCFFISRSCKLRRSVSLASITGRKSPVYYGKHTVHLCCAYLIYVLEQSHACIHFKVCISGPQRAVAHLDLLTWITLCECVWVCVCGMMTDGASRRRRFQAHSRAFDGVHVHTDEVPWAHVIYMHPPYVSISIESLTCTYVPSKRALR